MTPQHHKTIEREFYHLLMFYLPSGAFLEAEVAFLRICQKLGATYEQLVRIDLLLRRAERLLDTIPVKEAA